MRLACSALLLSFACGTLSNEDVAFLEALPQKGQIKVNVPQGDSAQPACAIGPADVWSSAKKTGDNINNGVDNILTLVDAIRAVPPTIRDTDARQWGPFPDGKHPGVDFQVIMQRELDAQRVPWRWVYRIEARRKPGDFLPILEGEFFGAQARNGIGRMTLHFENSQSLQIANPSDPAAPARVFYDLSSDPHTVSLDLTAGTGLGLQRFDYFYAGYFDGHGRFDYAIPGNNGCTLEITAYFNAQGAGRDVYRARCGAVVYGDVTQCFDVSACLTWVNDPFAFTAACNGLKPCLLGNAASCPAGL